MNTKARFWVAVLVLGTVILGFGQVSMATQTNAMSDRDIAVEECSSCHFFYPREMLPAFSWKKIIDNLDNHFGEDASFDKNSQAHTLTYLAAGRSTEIPLKITSTGWFKQRHGAGFKAMAGNSNIKLSNCGECHRSSF
ncbi:MAG: hypothetical protein JKY92_01640 [Magnetovibrio sp.]|nr:hypothetical protein [Magnetovibrio sp.]